MPDADEYGTVCHNEVNVRPPASNARTPADVERQLLAASVDASVRSLKGAALADAEEELKRLGDRRNAIEARLGSAASAGRTSGASAVPC